MNTYSIECDEYNNGDWRTVAFALSSDDFSRAEREQVARIKAKYGAKHQFGVRVVKDEVSPVSIAVDDAGRGVITLSDGREIRPGITIVASDGRKGVVTEVRPDNVYEDDPRKAAIFARPADCAYRVPFRNGTLIMATWWTFGAHCKLHGSWADSPSNTYLTADAKSLAVEVSRDAGKSWRVVASDLSLTEAEKVCDAEIERYYTKDKDINCLMDRLWIMNPKPNKIYYLGDTCENQMRIVNATAKSVEEES